MEKIHNTNLIERETIRNIKRNAEITIQNKNHKRALT